LTRATYHITDMKNIFVSFHKIKPIFVKFKNNTYVVANYVHTHSYRCCCCYLGDIFIKK